MRAQDRLTLFNALSALPPPQFGQLVFALNPPAGVVPGSSAAQGDRVSALLSWAESLGGCGLGDIRAVVEDICPGVLAPVDADPLSVSPSQPSRVDQLKIEALQQQQTLITAQFKAVTDALLFADPARAVQLELQQTQLADKLTAIEQKLRELGDDSQ